MKKLLLGTLALLTIAISNVQAQDSFYEGISKLDGVEFQEYVFCRAVPEKEGFYRAENPHREITLKVKNTQKGQPCGVTAFEKGGDSRGFVITDEITDYGYFSRSFPGVIVHKYNKYGYVFIDGMLIKLEGVSTDGLSYKSIGRIYLVKPTDEEIAAAEKAKEEEKKGMSMKEKMAAAKDVLKNGVKGTPSEEKLKSLKLDEVIKGYLKDMNTKHLAADKAKEAELVADLENERGSFLKDRQKESKEYAAKLEAQKAKYGDKAGSYIIKNNSGGPVKLITDSGSTSTLNAGSTTTFICSTDIYYCSGQSDKGSLIAEGSASCGQTITIE
jgi:hypothetical protein